MDEKENALKILGSLDANALQTIIEEKMKQEKARKEQEKAEEKARKEQERAEAKAQKEKERAEEKARREQERAEEKARREQEKAEEKARREQERAEEKARREQERAEEKARKEQEKAEEKARKEQEKADKEKANRDGVESIIENFKYEILELTPKTQWRSIIKNVFVSQGFMPTSDDINRLINTYVITTQKNKRDKYKKIGYELTPKGEVEDTPTNYEVFYNSFFKTKDDWNSLTDKTSKDYYVYASEWSGVIELYCGKRKLEYDKSIIRNLVRTYCPVKNKYIVDDGFEAWVKENRIDNPLVNWMLKRTEKGFEWDGQDRLGLVDINNDNIIMKVLDIEPTVLNKHMLNYHLIASVRALMWKEWGVKQYNWQHILTLRGETNCGKSKTIKDLFTIDGINWCSEELDVSANDWTIAPKMQQNWAVHFGERKGLSKVDNNRLKQWVDQCSGRIQYQKKNSNTLITYDSHNTAWMTTNDWAFLNDFSVNYEKRFYCLECRRTAFDFKKNYINTIEENRDQIWAQVYTFCIEHMDETFDLSDEEVEELGHIQESYKTINADIDLMGELAYLFNSQYTTDELYSYEQIKNDRFTDNYNGYDGHKIKFIGAGAFKDWCRSKKWDTRHINLINKENLLEKFGFEYKTYYVRSAKKSIKGYLRSENYEAVQDKNGKDIDLNDSEKGFF